MSCHRFRMVAWNKQPRWGCSSPWEGVCQWGHWTRVPPPLWRAVSSLAAQRGRESSSSSTEEHWGGRWPCGRWSSSRCRSGEGSVTMVRAPYPSRQWWWRCASEKEGIHQHWDQWKSWGIEWKSRACQNSSQTSYVQWGSKSFRCKLWLVTPPRQPLDPIQLQNQEPEILLEPPKTSAPPAPRPVISASPEGLHDLDWEFVHGNGPKLNLRAWCWATFWDVISTLKIFEFWNAWEVIVVWNAFKAIWLKTSLLEIKYLIRTLFDFCLWLYDIMINKISVLVYYNFRDWLSMSSLSTHQCLEDCNIAIWRLGGISIRLYKYYEKLEWI